MLDVKNVTTGFGHHTVLTDVSFTAEAPTIIGLVGPNGSGKSTLLTSLAGVHPFKPELAHFSAPLVGGGWC
ncbi:MAG: ATP-binding cassette domain-containing protein [Corynebacterium glucuronolyticum]|nr:ATP-binding cassette domain-containing protein [Mycobacteriaceae bacterium]MDY5835477.1 ATP-binding cassette domain-containing protein [Corynebacterium glucuronolyticum]